MLRGTELAKAIGKKKTAFGAVMRILRTELENFVNFTQNLMLKSLIMYNFLNETSQFNGILHLALKL